MPLILKYGLFLIITLFSAFLLLDFLYPLDRARLSKPTAYRIYDTNHKLLRLELSDDGYWRFFATSQEIPELLQKSVLHFEDRWFYWHFGFNPIAVFRALLHNISHERLIGASTISMQVARMMHHKKRTLLHKLSELLSALQLEWHYDKKTILNFYFNMAPYGGNIEGIKAASWFYFHKSPQELSISEIAILTTVPKNPNANRPDRAKNLLKKRDAILELLHKEDVIDASQYERALREPIVAKRFAIPSLAVQYTQNVPRASETDIVTGLDYEMQVFLKNTLHNTVMKLKEKNIHNGAALIIDNAKMEVVAYVGSDDFYHPQGQNDGVTMLRSPGSTLKPFIYAKAFDKGIITPQRELFDLPLHLGWYVPQNFNRRFMGIVSAQEALQNSLNIPAIELNHLLKEDSLYEMLHFAGIESLSQPKEYYGDALVLGGFGISLLDLTHLYTAFANEGICYSLHVGTKLLRSQKKLFSKEAAWLTSEILSDAVRPELSGYWESVKGLARIGFKTGTSADSKDLYTIAYTKEYTLGIWLGNFDGSKSDNLTGIDTAAKLAFEVFRELGVRKSLSYLKKPERVKQKELCKDALKLATCKRSSLDYYIEGVALQRPCELLRGEVLGFMMQTKMIDDFQALSQHQCFSRWSQYKPLLSSPYDGAEYIFDSQDETNSTKIMLKCYTFTQDKTLYWLIDEMSIFQGKSAQASFISLKRGEHTIGCLDSASSLTQNRITLKE